ncbi:uncharacterized protein F4807DRAFT_467895 [Annulohypoxylon truncatum]|uniref:uncharacterized protein n=1 Tax=Annulohypoxylon truncatum TaxID=327061 RepID=UPI002007D44B|nr:uncharacterized protein F4807DRAFT_467895 [Annulohypoxylon truncatum]KAI1208922.1 hypothetical protein F4807DRAFT_467895 [Annulohypoxylon truncatum]
MAEYAAAAITAITATAAIVGSAGAYRQQERIYRSWGSDEDAPWQPWQSRERPPFSNTRSRHTYGYYGQPLYHPPSFHEHYIHHVECPGAQCHYRAFNLRELSRIHAQQPRKSARDKSAEAERLYAYYVSKVRSVFEDHRRDHRRLFGQDYLCWAAPEREDPAQLQLQTHMRDRVGSPDDTDNGNGNGGRDGSGVGVGLRDIIRGASVIEEEGREEGTDCEEGREGREGKEGKDGKEAKDAKEGGWKSGHRGSKGSRRKNRSKTKSASTD